jgi:hypothetical protein
LNQEANRCRGDAQKPRRITEITLNPQGGFDSRRQKQKTDIDCRRFPLLAATPKKDKEDKTGFRINGIYGMIPTGIFIP